MIVKLPPFVALCGNPKSGKSLAQKILEDNFGYKPVDDGWPMRDFAMRHLGLTLEDVMTQEGKSRISNIDGTNWEHRKILGELGNKLEAMFGPHAMPYMAIAGCTPGELYSFGSVRRDQGAFYQKRGGIVLEIHNPLAPASRYEFDQYDSSIVDSVIFNDAQSKGMSPLVGIADLEAKIIAAINKFTVAE